MISVYQILVRKTEGKDLYENIGIDGNITLVWSLGKYGRKSGLDASGSG
jgi:hypothetical protein